MQKEAPTECSVVLSFCPSFVNPPKKVPHGLNEIDIRAPVRPNVSITTDSGKPCKVTEITSTSPSSWHVTYIIPAPPLTSGVHITAQTLQEKVSMRLMCIQTLAVGTRVVYLGPNWPSCFGTGRHGSTGVVEGVGSDYVIVKWEASQGQSYLENPPPEVDFGPSYCEVRTEF